MTTEPTPARDSHDQPPWNTPLSVDHADLLGGLLLGSGAEHVLDLGCGGGALLLRLTGARPNTTGIGIDADAALVDRARKLARAHGMDGRVKFVASDAGAWVQHADAVICVGAPHALGGTASALKRMADLMKPGGRILFGDGCWDVPPTPEAAAIFGDEVLPLAEIVFLAREAGLRVLHVSTADQREWDVFESSWRRERLAALPHGSFTAEQLETRLYEYLTAYRGVLGFSYLVLDRAP